VGIATYNRRLVFPRNQSSKEEEVSKDEEGKILYLRKIKHTISLLLHSRK
jgi:hypothetical protein